MSELPEDCVSEIISLLTSPRDLCRASGISKGFKSVADSDAVWEPFLPPDYPEIIARANRPVVFDTKKQLYFYLSDSRMLLDNRNLSFMLDKRSGKKCYMLGARELSITRQEDPRYWEWGSIPESRFPEVSILKVVGWLQIRGTIASVMLSQETEYAAYLVFRIAEDSRGLAAPAITKVKFGETEIETSNVYLKIPQASDGPDIHFPTHENERSPRRRTDGWMEVELGEFYCGEGDGGEVEMVFQEVKYLHMKCGLIVEGIELKPK